MADDPVLSVGDVFPVRGFPKYTYQQRAALEQAVTTYAEQGSGVLLVFGPTKSGKSVLVRKVLADALHIEASNSETAEDLWNAANTELGTHTTRSKGKETGQSHELTTTVGVSWWVRLTSAWKAMGSKKHTNTVGATDRSNVVVTRELLRQRRVLII